MNVSEATNWSTRGSAEAKYRALRCDVQLIDPASSEYSEVSDHLLNSQDKQVVHTCTCTNVCTVHLGEWLYQLPVLPQFPEAYLKTWAKSRPLGALACGKD